MKLTKPELASLEVAAVVQELQQFIGSKIDQIYESENREYVLQCHPRTREKVMLRIRPGTVMYASSQKPETIAAGSFCMQLRKYLDGGIIGSIDQIGAQRIVELQIRKSGENYILAIELFSKGNVIFSDDKKTIIGLLERQTWQSRELKPGIQYQYPPLETDIFTIEQKQAEKKIGESNKEKIVVSIATELGIGGTYAEEACFRADVDKNLAPVKLTKPQKSALWNAIKDIIAEIKKPQGYVYENMIAPIALQTQQLKEKIPTFNEALEKVLSTSKQDREKQRKESQFKQKIASLQHIASEQQQKLQECEKRTEEETKKAEWIYSHYREIKQLLELVEKSRASGGWQAVTETLKKMKKIKSIDLKEKKITVEIEEKIK